MQPVLFYSSPSGIETVFIIVAQFFDDLSKDEAKKISALQKFLCGVSTFYKVAFSAAVWHSGNNLDGDDFMRYHVELKTGRHMSKSVPAANIKWEASHQLPYHLQPPQQRYQLQRHLRYAYGRTMAKALTVYVYDFLRRGFDAYAWWQRGKRTEILCQDDKFFFHLYLYPIQ